MRKKFLIPLFIGIIGLIPHALPVPRTPNGWDNVLAAEEPGSPHEIRFPSETLIDAIVEESKRPLPPDGPLLLEGTAHVPAGILGQWIRENFHPTGTMEVAYQIRGTRQSPRISARLRVQEGTVTIIGISEPIHGITGSALLSPEALVIEELTGRLGNSGIRLSGRFDFHDPALSTVQIDLSFKDLPVSIPDTLEARIGGALFLRGTLQTPRLTGEVDLISGTWIRDTHLNPIRRQDDALPGPSQSPPPVTTGTPDFLENLSLDIQVRHQSPFWVDNNLTRLALVPDLRISGSGRHPAPVGRALVEEGEISYQNKRFEIDKGAITFFIPPLGTEPMVDILANAEIRKWRVRLALSGTPDALNVALSSDPPLEESDIVSLMVLGRTSEDLIAKEGGSPVSTSTILAGLIDSTYGTRFKKTTGLDILEAENIPDEDADEPDRIRFTIGENLSNRMTLKYATETRKGLFIQQFISEYKLLDKLIVSGYQDSEAAYGASLTYRLEFR